MDRRRALLAASQTGGGGKMVNRITVRYYESGPDEWAVFFTPEYRVASVLSISVGTAKSLLDPNTNTSGVGIPMCPVIPTISNTTISPTEDDTYIYELVFE